MTCLRGYALLLAFGPGVGVTQNGSGPGTAQKTLLCQARIIAGSRAESRCPDQVVLGSNCAVLSIESPTHFDGLFRTEACRFGRADAIPSSVADIMSTPSIDDALAGQSVVNIGAARNMEEGAEVGDSIPLLKEVPFRKNASIFLKFGVLG